MLVVPAKLSVEPLSLLVKTISVYMINITVLRGSIRYRENGNVKFYL